MLTLYEHPFALYCQKVLIALYELDLAFEVREEQRDFGRAELAALWPPASIPVLRDGDRLIGESSIIIEHVGGERLVPTLEARLWDRICDEYVSNSVQAIVAAALHDDGDERPVARARERLAMAYGMLEARSPGARSWPVRCSRSPTAPPRPGCSTRSPSRRGTRTPIRG